MIFGRERDDLFELVITLTSKPIYILAENCTRVRAGITGTRRTQFDVSNIVSGWGLTGRIGVMVTWVAGRRVVVNIVIVWPVVIFVVRSWLRVAVLRSDGTCVIVELGGFEIGDPSCRAWKFYAS